MICEGAMHLHNFLVEYRDEHDVDYQYDCEVFNNDRTDNGHTSGVVFNDFHRPRGRPTNIEERSRLKGLQIRDNLRQLIQDNGMHRPCNNM